MSDTTPTPDADARRASLAPDGVPVAGLPASASDALRVEFVTVGQPRHGGWAAVNDAGQPRDLPAGALVDLRTVHPGQRLRAEVRGDRVVSAEIP